MKIIEGKMLASGMRTSIIASRFNKFIVDKLVDGARDFLSRHGADDAEQTLVWVPGAWEIPLAAKSALLRKPDAVICLGCVVRGGTIHFEQVAEACARGIAALSLESGIPVLNGVLATENFEQALDRAGGKMGNKGADASAAAVEMINTLRALKG